MGIFSFLTGSSKSKEEELELPVVDLHSHFLPGIDDGSSSIDETLSMLRSFQDMGFRKVITTPHVSEGFDNSPELIRAKLEEVRSAVNHAGLTIQVEAAAEYFLDENFLSTLREGREILSFGDRYVLVETAFMTKPIMLVETVKELQAAGYRPIYAHPERYNYLQGNWEAVKQIYNSGILFQVNALSFVGYYDEGPRRLAERLVDEGMVSFIGSDCHKPKHAANYAKARATKHYRKAVQNQILNNWL